MNYTEVAQLRINYNKPIILDKLKELCISKIDVEYSGGGDSGSIDEIIPTYESEEMPDLENFKVKVKHAHSSLNRETGEWVLKIEDKEESLNNAIETLCYDIISIDFSGWENNEGGRGSFEFEVAEGRIYWHHTEYVMTEDTHDYVY